MDQHTDTPQSSDRPAATPAPALGIGESRRAMMWQLAAAGSAVGAFLLVASVLSPDATRAQSLGGESGDPLDAGVLGELEPEDAKPTTLGSIFTVVPRGDYAGERVEITIHPGAEGVTYSARLPEGETIVADATVSELEAALPGVQIENAISNWMGLAPVPIDTGW